MVASIWDFSDEVWRQSHINGQFSPLSVGGKQLANAEEIDLSPYAARFLGAKPRALTCSKNYSDCSFYPGKFRFCPNCGKELPDVPVSSTKAWLPPFGNALNRPSSKPTGLRLTQIPFQISRNVEARRRPDIELSIPGPGDFHFLVSPLGTKSSALIAISPRNAALYLWVPEAKEWCELVGERQEALSEWRLPVTCWGLASNDLVKSPDIWIPTDDGLCRLTIDLIARQYHMTYSGNNRCVGAPVRFGSHLLVPSVTADGTFVIVKVGLEGGSSYEEVIINGVVPPITRFESGIAQRRAVIWECAEGQLRIRERPSVGTEALFLKWPEFYTPDFRLGSPYLGNDDRLWRQCFNGQNSRYAYVELANEQPEIRPTDGPRFCTGSLNFRMGIPIKINPWDEILDSSNISNEIVFPIVESDDSDVVACMVAESGLSVHRVLSSVERISGRFAIRGDATANLLNIDIAKPWEARIFVYDSHLYLYHAEFHMDTHKIPGWRLES